VEEKKHDEVVMPMLEVRIVQKKVPLGEWKLKSEKFCRVAAASYDDAAGDFLEIIYGIVGVGSGGRTHDIQSHSLAFCH
jgi:hypothetical protein